MTTQLLKKCVLIPHKHSEEEEKIYAEHPFKRGSMKFDDFNYQIYNPYILIEDLTATMTAEQKSAHKAKIKNISVKQDTETLSYDIIQKVGAEYTFENLAVKTQQDLETELEFQR